jgi:hypothetical protein
MAAVKVRALLLLLLLLLAHVAMQLLNSGSSSHNSEL